MTAVGVALPYAVRQGWPRSDGHGGSGVGTAIPGITGSTTFDGWPTEWAMSLVTVPFAGSESKVQNGRLPPGASTVMRNPRPGAEHRGEREQLDARLHELAGGQRRGVGLQVGVPRPQRGRVFGSSLRWLARSQPLCT